jgi:methionine aminotransferase
LLSIQSRLPDVGTTIFTVMSKMALDYGAINLSQGFPDFPMDEKLISLVNRAMLEGFNQYAPMPGLPELRNAIADVVSKTYSRTIDADQEVTVVAGGTQALFSAVAAFISQGDEVLLFDPSYDSYDPAVRLNGGVPVHIELNPPYFKIDWDSVEKMITNKTRMIMINTPQNPTGAVMSENDMRSLEKIVLKYGLIVVSDEVYERIIFDELQHQSVIRFPGLYSQSVASFSFGKTFHATGWKIGYTIAPPELTKEIRKTHQFITFSVNAPMQKGLAEYLSDPSTYQTLGSFYQQKRDFFLEQIKGSSFEPISSKGSYFQLVSYKAISSKPEIEMAEELTKRFKVAAIPVSVFYKRRLDQQLLRFCFAKKEETLEKAGSILRKL